MPIGAEPRAALFHRGRRRHHQSRDFRQILTASPHTPGQLISTVNNLHPNTKAYVRVWRTEPAFQLEGADLPDPPASVALILEGSQTSQAGITQTAQFENRRNGNRRRRHGDLRRQNRPGGSEGMKFGHAPFSAPRSASRRPHVSSSRGSRQRHRRLGNELVRRFHPRPFQRHLAQPRRPPFAGAQSGYRLHFRPARHLEPCRRSGRHALRRHRKPRPRLPHRPRRQIHACCGPPTSRKSSPSPWIQAASSTPAPRRTARSTASKTARPPNTSRPNARYIWSLAVAPDGALYVGTGDQGKIFRVDAARQGRALLRYRPVAHHRPRRGFPRPPAGRHRTQRHPVPHFGQRQGVRALRRQPAGNSRHRPHAGWHCLRRRAGRFRGQAGAGRRAGGAGR